MSNPVCRTFRAGQLLLMLCAGLAGAADDLPPTHLQLAAIRSDALNQPKGAKSTVLGGESAGQLYVELDGALLQKIVLKPEDLVEAALRLTVHKSTAAPGNMTVSIYRTTHAILKNSTGMPKEGVDFETPAIATSAVPPQPENGMVRIPFLPGALTRAAVGQPGVGMLVRLESKEEKAPELVLADPGERKPPVFDISLRPCGHAELFQNELKPQPGIFTHFENGHLFYGDKRLRLWGVVGQPHADRLVKMGFNAVRVWDPNPAGFYSDSSAKRGETTSYVKGDGSRTDLADKQFADIKAHGLFVMFAALQNGMPVLPLATNDSFIAPGKDPSSKPEDWEEWKAAILTSKPGAPATKWGDDPKLVFVDDRLKAIRKCAAKNLLTHVNLYTGKCYGEDECIAIYEIFNENGFAKYVLESGYEQWPPYFQAKLKQRWINWLKEKYADDAALAAAWGKLNSGESLKSDAIVVGPAIGKHGAYPAARASDFVHFVLDLTDGYNQEYRAYCRSLAPKGVGVNVAPFSFDTQYRPNLAWNYTNSRAEVNSFGMYFWDLSTALNRPPSMYVIDGSTVEGAATVLYETNQARPNPCRAEYPLRLAALAGMQDWDGVIWHYWSPADESDESYLNTPMAYMNVDHYWTAVQHQNDPVMCSAMAIAGQIFLHNAIHAAPKPVVAEVGKSALYSYNAFNGVSINQQAFTSGSKMRFEVSKASGVTIDGAQAAQRITEAVAGGDEILWDWPNARLIIDAPTVKAYVGKFSGPYKFKDGIVLSNVSTPFVVFTMASADGRKLTGPDAAQRINMMAVADARNTNFKFNWDVQGGPVEMAKAIIDRGRPPVIVDEVKYDVWFPTVLEGRLVAYDFALRNCSERNITGTNQIVSGEPTPFMSVLTINTRGAERPVPEIAAAVAVNSEAPLTGPDASKKSANESTDGPWRPIPELAWEMRYTDAHALLKNSKLVYTSISNVDISDKSSRTITLTDAQLPTLWDAPADIEIKFDNAGTRSVNVTFKRPPQFKQAVVDLKRQFGDPMEMKEGTQFERSLARWEGGLNVSMTESQGILKIQFTRK